MKTIKCMNIEKDCDNVVQIFEWQLNTLGEYRVLCSDCRGEKQDKELNKW
jgi:hypothetical protein